MSEPFKACLPPGLNPAYLTPQPAITKQATQATTVNPNILHRAPTAHHIQQPERNFGTPPLDSLPSRAGLAMANLQGKSGSTGEKKECNKCKHTYPIGHYQFQDAFNRTKERVNCHTCRTKRRASDKARIRREKEAQRQDQQPQVQPQGQRSQGKIVPMADPANALAGQRQLPAVFPPQQPVLSMDSIAFQGPMPDEQGKITVYRYHPKSVPGHIQGPRGVFSNLRRASAPVTASNKVSGSLSSGRHQTRITSANPVLPQGHSVGLGRVSKSVPFMGLSGKTPGIQANSGLMRFGSITTPGSARVKPATCPFRVQTSPGVLSTAESSSPSPLLPSSEYSSTAASSFSGFHLAGPSSVTDFGGMSMDWYGEPQANSTDYAKDLDGSAQAEESTAKEYQIDKPSQNDNMLPKDHCPRQVRQQESQNNEQLQSSDHILCTAQQEDDQQTDDDGDQETEGNARSHSLPVLSPAQLASLSPLERQTRERWELGLQKCMQLRAMDTRTLNCLWEERQAAAKAGIEICPHTAETPEELWQIPINTPLLYPESHFCIAQAFPSGGDDDLDSHNEAMGGL
ncbi:hypothetical protein ACHAQA_003876 [Verticillium albo-atrum]